MIPEEELERIKALYASTTPLPWSFMGMDVITDSLLTIARCMTEHQVKRFAALEMFAREALGTEGFYKWLNSGVTK